MRAWLRWCSATIVSLAHAACSQRGAGPATSAPSGDAAADSEPTAVALAPHIDGPFWQIAGEPDLGPYNQAGQQPVDFSLWQAADGTWQLWSCIRFTGVGGQSRLLYHWEGQNLTDTHWAPIGIAMQADSTLGETPGGLQAPYVKLIGGIFHMFYGDWQHVCHATSTDGKTFTRVIQPSGMTGMFDEGSGSYARDPMVLPIGDTLYAYYTAAPNGLGADYARTSTDLATWSPSTRVAFGGRAGTGGSSAECPFVVYRPEARAYFLFRTQQYGQNAQTSIYRSQDPLYFGVDDDRYFVETLPVAAPEMIEANGQTYIAALLPTLQGIQVAKLRWDTAP